MPLSTSSSEGARWIASWALAALLAVTVLGTWEIFWRSNGFMPVLHDDAALWAMARGRANDLGTEAVALIGSSRMQMNVNSEAFSSVTGWKHLVQLSIVNGPSTPILQGLARDPKFRGTVLCEINPALFYTNTPRMDIGIALFERSFQRFDFSDLVEQRLRMILQSNFVIGLPRLSPSFLRMALVLGKLPLPAFSELSPERFRTADYLAHSNLDRGNAADAAIRRKTPPKRLTPELFEQRIYHVKRLARAIRQRGGAVIFIRLPSAIQVLAYEERWFPRGIWWEAFAAQMEAATIHFLDEPTLARFEPLDGEHLDKRNAVIFSNALGKVLVRRFLAPGSNESR